MLLAVVVLLSGCGGGNRTPWLDADRGGASQGRHSGPVPPAVVVQRGDTVYGISRRFGIPMRAIIDSNGLAPPYALAIGQRLILPRPRVHTVQRGDTLSEIARGYGVDMGEIARLNRLGAPYIIHVGQVLSLPTDNGVQVARGGGSSIQPPPPGKPSPSVAAPVPPRQPEPAPPPRSAKAFAWPVSGRVVSRFGPTGNGQRNDGINIAIPEGTPVRAAENGVVVYAGNELKGFGNLLLIKHDGGWMTAYGHNASLSVSRGQSVRRGEVIAKAGKSGNVTTPQVHFEVRKGSQAVDPLAYLERQVAASQ